jgi:hypothetical protein
MRGRVVARAFLGSILGIVLVLAEGSYGQRPRHLPSPPPPVIGEPLPQPKSPPKPNTAAMEQEARELADLAATVPGDVEQLKKGLLPKDVLDKLKRIEKLSKQLRSQVQP